MTKLDIWMPLYIGDYLADTTRLTTEQHGAYLLLIMDYWRNGPPPDDDVILANITKMTAKDWKRTKPAVAGLFKLKEGVWHHTRVDKEIVDAAVRGAKAEEKAKKAAEARWSKHPVEHPVKQSPSTESSSPSSNAPSDAPSIATSTAQAVHEECQSQSQSPLKSKTEEKAKSKAEAAPATRLPKDWQPDFDQVAFCNAERPDLQALAVGDRFRDYWIAVPGMKGRKVDWDATWRNWVRNERGQAQARASPSYASARDQRRSAAARGIGLGGDNHGPDGNIIDINCRTLSD